MRDRTLLVGGIAAALLGVVLMWAAPGVDGEWFAWHHGSWTAGVATPEVALRLEGAGSLPASVTVVAGRPSLLTIANDGPEWHELEVGGIGLVVSVGPRATVTVDLPALEPGVHPISCTRPEHAAAGPVGIITAEA